MNIFDQLDDIITHKKNKISEDCEFEKEFTPYMIQRWLSFYSIPFCQIVNISSNTLWKSMEDKQMWYSLFSGVIPRSPKKGIRYIKKNKEGVSNKKIDDSIISYLSKQFELPQKTIKEYLNEEIIDIKSIKKQLQE